MILGCVAGGVVFTHLPVGRAPTLRQAIVAANVPLAGNPIQGLDGGITAWSWGCDGKNYTVAFYPDNGSNTTYENLHVARYDDDKSVWSEQSFHLGETPLARLKPGVVTAVFADGYYLYVGLESEKHIAEVLQFTRGLEYRHGFFGNVSKGLFGGALLYFGCVLSSEPDAKDCDEGTLVFDPDTGKSHQLEPFDRRPPILAQRIKDLGDAYKLCGPDWFKIHRYPQKPEDGPSLEIGEDYNYDTDAYAIGVYYTNKGFDCPVPMPPERFAIYIFDHVTDAARMQRRELPASGKADLENAKLKSLLTKDSLAKLFGKSQSTLTDPVPSPIPVTTSPAPTNTSAPVLAGITLGEDADGVLRRFGLHPRGWSSGGVPGVGEIRAFPAHEGDVVVAILFDTKIQSVIVTGTGDPRAHFADPYGVRLGDTVERLEQVRGPADEKSAHGDLRYGPIHGVHWSYSIKDDRISDISLSDGS